MRSRGRAGLALPFLSLLAASCAHPAAAPPTFFARPAAAPRATATPTANPNAAAMWAIGAANACPSKGSVTIDVRAINADGKLITGTFKTPILLSDGDTSHATRIAPTKISSNGQRATLSYNGKPVAPFSVTAAIGSASTSVLISPHAPCVNASPDVLTVSDGSSGSILALGAANGASAPYDLGSESTNAPNGCGAKVQLYQTSATQFRVVSEMLSGGPFGVGMASCWLYATAGSGNVITPHALLILSK